MNWAAAIGLSLCGCASVTPVPGTYPGDLQMWESLVASPEVLALPGRPVGAVAPHHLIDGFELAAFWRALAATGPASAIVVIGPDHRAQGGGELTLGDRLQYQTVFGPLTPDPGLVAQLKPLAGSRDGAFVTEHSIHAHAPYIRHYFPAARFVPLIVRWASDPKTLEALAVGLDKALPPDALVVASVDFSHFQGEPWATFHDESAWATVSRFDLDALREREVDSPESLWVAMRFAQLRGAQRATRVLHTNSQARRSVFVPDSTSHQYVSFTRGEPAPEPTVNVLVTGEVSKSTGLTFRDSWRWHSFVPENVPAEPRLADVRGQEDRFFMGPDAFLFRLEPGERIARTINGIPVAFAAVDLSSRIDVRALKGSAACLFLLAWRCDASADEAASRARTLADDGADVVIGRGFGPSLPLEHRGSSLVALSLGAFLPDALGPAEGAALGVTWSASGVRARAVPITVVDGRPRVDLDRLAESMGYPPPSRQPVLERE